jgi:hypothetical protein
LRRGVRRGSAATLVCEARNLTSFSLTQFGTFQRGVASSAATAAPPPPQPSLPRLALSPAPCAQMCATRATCNAGTERASPSKASTAVLLRAANENAADQLILCYRVAESKPGCSLSAERCCGSTLPQAVR